MKCHAIADVTDPNPPEVFFKRIEQLSRLGVEFIQLRAKPLADRDIIRVGTRVRRLINSPRTRLIVNQRADLAVAIGADGVQLPAAGIPVDHVRSISAALLAGRSCHTLAECAIAAEEHADWILLGPVFRLRSKEGEGRWTRDELQRAAALGPEVFALGGVARENISWFRGLSLAGLAGITVFMHDEPVSQIVEEIRAI